MRKSIIIGSILLFLMLAANSAIINTNPSGSSSSSSSNGNGTNTNNTNGTTNGSLSGNNSIVLNISDYSETVLNVSALTGAVNTQVNAAVNLLELGNFVSENSTLAAAVQRQFANGTIQYDLYLDYVDPTLNIVEYEAIIRMVSPAEYLLVNLTNYNFQPGNGSDNTANTNSANLANQVTAPAASSLSGVVTLLTNGYSLLSSSQIAADKELNIVDGEFRTLFGVSQATLSYAAENVVGSQTSYKLFYQVGSGSNFQFQQATALYDAGSKILYLFQFLQVVVPASLFPK